MREHPNPWPGTDDLTGWSLSPEYPCVKDSLGLPTGKVLCHLRLTGETFSCAYMPASCPFFGRYPSKIPLP